MGLQVHKHSMCLAYQLMLCTNEKCYVAISKVYVDLNRDLRNPLANHTAHQSPYCLPTYFCDTTSVPLFVYALFSPHQT